MQDMDGYELGGQNDINDFLKGVHTFRVGMEALIAPQFSLRAGYNYSTAAFQDYAYNSLSLYGTNTDFNNTNPILSADEDVDMDKIIGTSDMKKVKDLKGNPLLLFVNSWSVRMTLERNEGLILSEFGRS